MRNRIPIIFASILLVILTVTAFGHPAHAQSNGSSGSLGSSANLFGVDPILDNSNQSFVTNQSNISPNSVFAPTSNGTTGTTPPGNISSAGAASTAPAPTAIAPCNPPFHLSGCIVDILANTANSVLGAVSVLVTVAGAIMSFSIVLTLHIRDFVNATPAIFAVWTTLRDITSLFFIFFLLYAAFKIILGMDEKIGELIKNLVLAGILINFSFFITGAMIDASNIVSQTLYNAMVPASVTAAAVNDINSCNPSNGGSGNCSMSTMVQDVTGMNPNSMTGVDSTKYGISDIFRNAFQLSTVSGGASTQTAVEDPLKTLFIIVIGIMIMIVAFFSFLLAAIVFIARLVILLFLLAFSPLWFASWIIPQVKKEFDFTKTLMSQLIFMPVYLLLMYVALKVISGSHMLTAANPTAFGSGVTNWLFSYITLAVNFTIVVILLNLPLIVGLKMGGMASSWLKLDKLGLDAGSLFKKFSSQVGSRTAGRMAYSLNERITPSLAKYSPLAASMSNAALSKVSKAGFGEKKGGYEDRLKAKKKAQEDLHKRIGEMVENRTGDKEKAREAQEAYRNKMVWKAGGLNPGYGSGIIGFMVDNRANKQSHKKLEKQAGDENKKEVKKKAEEKKKELLKEKKKIDNGTSGHTSEEARFARRREIDDEIEALDEQIAEGKAVEEKENNDKVLSKLDDIDKKSGGGGGGGGEKKE